MTRITYSSVCPSLAATAPYPDTDLIPIIAGVGFVLAMSVVVVVYWLARKRAPVEEQNQASALESGCRDHVVVKEGGGGYWPPPPPPSAPPVEELERGGAGPVRKEVYGEIVEEDYDMRRK